MPFITFEMGEFNRDYVKRIELDNAHILLGDKCAALDTFYRALDKLPKEMNARFMECLREANDENLPT